LPTRCAPAITEPVTVEPSLPLDEALRLMAEHDTAHLIVADRARPIGILSTLDVAGVLAWGRGSGGDSALRS
jgi:CBS domain-containing protein